jgi:hypothetical protein
MLQEIVMRTREEILKKFNEGKVFGMQQIMSPEGRAQVNNDKLILEVLLDIRDILNNESEE